jgi:hypothetical protein
MQAKRSRPIPVVTGYLAPGSKQIKVWCEHCGQYHLHGAPDGVADDNQHYAAQCYVPGSPYRGTGYLIKVIRTAAPKRRRRPFRYPRR